MNSTQWNPYEIISRQPVPAEMEIPAALIKMINESDDHYFIIEIDDNKRLRVFSEEGNCGEIKIDQLAADRLKIQLNCTNFRKSHLGKSQGKLSFDELKQYAGRGGQSGYRPKWMPITYNPGIIPRRNRRLEKYVKGICGANIPLAVLDRKELVDFKSYPWCTVGKVLYGKNENYNSFQEGSGVLVGRNLLLTCSHGVPWGEQSWWIKFIPGENNNTEPFGSSFVESYRGIPTEKDNVHGRDYVICKLYKPLGDIVGWMGTQAFGDDDDYYNGTWTSVGYPTDAGIDVPFVEPFLTIEDVDDDSDGKELETYQFSTGGWSGGPLWGWIGNEPKVIGIMSGNETDFTLAFWEGFSEDHSVSAGGNHMVDLVNYGIANWGI